MKIKNTLVVIFYGLVIFILRKSNEPYIIVLCYILLVQPFLSMATKSLNLNLDQFWSKDKTEALIKDKLRLENHLFDLLLFVLSLLVLIFLSWYTFTIKLSLLLK